MPCSRTCSVRVKNESDLLFPLQSHSSSSLPTHISLSVTITSKHPPLIFTVPSHRFLHPLLCSLHHCLSSKPSHARSPSFSTSHCFYYHSSGLWWITEFDLGGRSEIEQGNRRWSAVWGTRVALSFACEPLGLLLLFAVNYHNVYRFHKSNPQPLDTQCDWVKFVEHFSVSGQNKIVFWVFLVFLKSASETLQMTNLFSSWL